MVEDARASGGGGGGNKTESKWRLRCCRKLTLATTGSVVVRAPMAAMVDAGEACPASKLARFATSSSDVDKRDGPAARPEARGTVRAAAARNTASEARTQTDGQVER